MTGRLFSRLLRDTKERSGLFWFSLVCTIYLCLTYLSPLLNRSEFLRLIAEDGPVETLGAIGFLLTSLFFALTFLRRRKPATGPDQSTLKSFVLIVMVLLFLFGAGEELSWGQRLIGIQTPDAFAQFNAQNELTVHNLRLFQDREQVLPEIDQLFSYFWLTFAFLIPLCATLWQSVGRWLERRIPILPWMIGVLFPVNYLFSKLAEHFFSPATYNGICEIKESNFAVLFGAAAFFVLTQKSGTDQPTDLSSSCPEDRSGTHSERRRE